MLNVHMSHCNSTKDKNLICKLISWFKQIWDAVAETAAHWLNDSNIPLNNIVIIKNEGTISIVSTY